MEGIGGRGTGELSFESLSRSEEAESTLDAERGRPGAESVPSFVAAIVVVGDDARGVAKRLKSPFT